MLNALTIDVEDYFQVQAFSDIIRYEDWGNYESRVEGNTRRILDLLADPSSLVSSNLEHRTLNVEHCAMSHELSAMNSPDLEPRTPVRATFFILGWIAERYPGLIKEIHSQGHEIACHGYAHRLIYEQSPGEFREDVEKAKAILEDITGGPVIGYRAPSYSITRDSLWAFEVLMKEGFYYDSSIFPIRHDFYGLPKAPRFPFLVSLNNNGTPEFKPLFGTENVEPRTLNFEHCVMSPQPGTRNPEPGTRNPQSIIEFPISTVRLAKINLPLSGGGYFRFFPYFMTKKGLKMINGQEGKPFVFYMHPWELDIEQPRISGAGLKSKFRHYVNLNKTETRFKRLLKEFNFSSIKDILFNQLQQTW